MGKNNRARRAARARQRAQGRARADRARADRAQARGRDPRQDSGPLPGDAERAELAWATVACVGRHGGWVDRRAALSVLDRIDRCVTLAAAERLLLQQVSRLWDNGWQPGELHRQARVGGGATRVVRLVELAVATDCVRRLDRRERLHPAWRQQAAELTTGPAGAEPGWLGRWSTAAGITSGPEAHLVVADALRLLFGLPALDALVPPPGRAEAPGRRRPAMADDPMLRRVRHLLQKAESTEFEAEATAFTAKAQELITRHAIDTALLSGEADPDREPVMIRVPVDPPYADAKSLLLQTVAVASRCRTVYLPRLALSNVVGFEADLAAVEVLFTSLLVQAQQGMSEAARTAAPGTRTRSPAFRSTFLLAYCQRIGERLDEVNAHVFGATAADSARYLPVLGSQQAAVDAFLADRFPATQSGRVRGGYDPAGWTSGRLAADRARLSAGDLDGSRA